MKLILRAPILAALVGLGGAMGTHAAADVNYTGNWWNPDQNGMGMPCVQQDQTIFCTWFLYDGAGRGTFLFSSGVLQKDAQGRNYYAADLQRASGTPPAGFDPTHTTVASVGTMSLTFTGADSATFTFQFDVSCVESMELLDNRSYTVHALTPDMRQKIEGFLAKTDPASAVPRKPE